VCHQRIPWTPRHGMDDLRLSQDQMIGTATQSHTGHLLLHFAQIDAIFVSGLPRGGNGS